MNEYLLFILSSLISSIINFGRKKKEYSRILLVRLDRAGDIICSLPAIINLRRELSSARIDLLTLKGNISLFEGSKLIDNYYIYPKELKEKFKLLQNIRSSKYHLIIGMREDLFMILSSLFLYPNKKIDRGSVRINIWLKFFMKKFFRTGAEVSKHELDTNKLLMQKVIQNYKETENIFHFTPDQNAWIKEFLMDNNLKGKDYAVIHPGASWEFRRWDTSKFIQTGKYLYSRYNIRTVIVGSPEESDIAGIIANGDSKAFINTTGKTTFIQLANIITNCMIAICNDSAPMHIAALSGIPTIGLMGPGDLLRFSPRGKRTVTLHKRVECYPCKQITCKYPDHPCVNLNTIEDVKQHIDKFLTT